MKTFGLHLSEHIPYYSMICHGLEGHFPIQMTIWRILSRQSRAISGRGNLSPTMEEQTSEIRHRSMCFPSEKSRYPNDRPLMVKRTVLIHVDCLNRVYSAFDDCCFFMAWPALFNGISMDVVKATNSTENPSSYHKIYKGFWYGPWNHCLKISILLACNGLLDPRQRWWRKAGPVFSSNFAAFVPGENCPESNDQWLFLPDTKSSGLYLKDFWIHCGWEGPGVP